jgi:hypothetical protein
VQRNPGQKVGAVNGKHGEKTLYMLGAGECARAGGWGCHFPLEIGAEVVIPGRFSGTTTAAAAAELFKGPGHAIYGDGRPNTLCTERAESDGMQCMYLFSE